MVQVNRYLLVALAVFAVVGGYLGTRRALEWVPPSNDVINFRMGEEQVPVIDLRADGLMVIHVPSIMKEWETKKKAEAIAAAKSKSKEKK